MVTLATRCYRYALRPTPAQEAVLDGTRDRLRHLWNELVSLHRYAEREWQRGRRATLQREYAQLLQRKKAVGMAMVKARAYADEHHVTVDAALVAVHRAAAQHNSRMICTKAGKPLRRLSCRQFAIEYAIERAGANAGSKHDGMPIGGWGLITKFRDATKLYLSGKRGRPKFKRKEDPIAVQIQRAWKPSAEPLDLSPFGGQALVRVNWIQHRPLPVGAEVKQVALTGRGQRRFIVFMVEAPESAFALDFPVTDAVAGIDPGRKTALSVSSLDGSKTLTIEPPLLRRDTVLRKMRRAGRLLDRQRRANNPHCFDEQGRWIKGQRAYAVSANMRKTKDALAELQRRIADARSETYHLAARQLLREFDVIGVGTWRGNGSAPGVGRAKRGQNRKDYDNAVGLFRAVLADKAQRSSSRKQVLAVPEAGTTKTCLVCGEGTGPAGLKDLKIRCWTCTKCGTTHQRDFASARAIARKAQTAAGTQPEQPVAVRPRTQRRRRLVRQTQGSVQTGQVPVADETGIRKDRSPISTSPASAAGESPKVRPACGPEPLVTGVVATPARRSPSPTARKRGYRSPRLVDPRSTFGVSVPPGAKAPCA